MNLMATWTIQAVFIVSAASFSFIASTTIVIMIIRAEVPGTHRSEPTPTLKSSPYHRIILGLSISDMFQSLALLLGPFLPPEQVYQAFWSVGNNTSCTIDGLFLTIGAVGTPLYTLFLCYYSMSRVEKRHVFEPAGSFASAEKMCHGVIVVFTLVLALVALFTKTLNTYPTGMFCTVAATPTGCRQYPELFGECDESVAGYVKDLVLVGFLLVPLFALLGIVVCMGRIYRYVLFVGPRVFQGSADVNVVSRLREKKPSIPSGNGSTEIIPVNIASDVVDVESETIDSTNSVREYRRQILIQASLYILVYLVTYILVLGLSISNVFFKVNPTIYWNFVMSTFYPLGGFLNIVVYNRPKVVSLRMKHPELSILQAFTMVVRAGSAVPMVVINRESDLLDRLPGSQSDIGSHPSSRITPSIDLGCRMSTDGVMNNRSESESETKHIYQFYPRAADNARLVGAGITVEKESADFSFESKSSGNTPEKGSADFSFESKSSCSFQMPRSHNSVIDTIAEEEERGSEDVESAA